MTGLPLEPPFSDGDPDEQLTVILTRRELALAFRACNEMREQEITPALDIELKRLYTRFYVMSTM